MAWQPTWATSRKTKAETGFRSGLEVALAKHLDEAQIAYRYEEERVPYTKRMYYLADFTLKDQAIIVETKGAFSSEDRTKMLRVKAEHPDLDIRFLFSNPNTRLGRLSKTTYGMWCSKHGFPFAKGPVPPPEWLVHVPSEAQVAALERVLKQ